MDISPGSLQSAELAETASIPIATLDPSQPPPVKTSIKGVVSLLWPYSSSHSTFALLLAAPDFRLRNRKGQIKIQLKGKVAEAVAKTRIGIGDYAHLSLAGAQWVKDVTSIETPGRSVEGNLLYKSRILIQIQKDGEKLPALDIDFAAPTTPESPPPDAIATPQRQVRLEIEDTPASTDLSRSWRTPANFRPSLEAARPTAIDLFGDEDAFDERPAKRSKVWRSSGHWRLVDHGFDSSEEETPDEISKPAQIDGPSDLDKPISKVSSSAQIPSQDADISSPMLMQVSIDRTSPPRLVTETRDLAVPSSPTLRPLPSAVLPQVSPVTLSVTQPPVSPSELLHLPNISPETIPSEAVPSDPTELPLSFDGLQPSYDFLNKSELLMPPSSPLRSHETALEIPVDDVKAQTPPNELTRKQNMAIETLGIGDSYATNLQTLSSPFTDMGPFNESNAKVDQPHLTTETSPRADRKYETAQNDDNDDLYSRPEYAEELLATKSLEQKELVIEKPQILEAGQPTPDASQGTKLQNETGVFGVHRVDDILDGRLPPTPQSSSLIAKAAAPSSSLNTASEGEVATKVFRGSRRSFNFAPIQIPTAISPWFTSRSQHGSGENNRNDKDGNANDASIRPNSDDVRRSNSAVALAFSPAVDKDQDKAMQVDTPALEQKILSAPTADFRTALSYYSALATLDRYVNNTSQIGENLVDVMTVVSSPTAETGRAKTGPKDFYTYLKVVDSSSFPDAVQVQIFRPFKMSLPTAEAGDVILLRNFTVKTRNRKPFLLSGQSSAWCVWRFKHNNQQPDHSIPIWATKKRQDAETPYQECRGPPVEIGSEEQECALLMRAWWDLLQQKRHLAANGDEQQGIEVNISGTDHREPNVEAIAVGT